MPAKDQNSHEESLKWALVSSW